MSIIFDVQMTADHCNTYVYLKIELYQPRYVSLTARLI